MSGSPTTSSTNRLDGQVNKEPGEGQKQTDGEETDTRYATEMQIIISISVDQDEGPPAGCRILCSITQNSDAFMQFPPSLQ